MIFLPRVDDNGLDGFHLIFRPRAAVPAADFVGN